MKRGRYKHSHETITDDFDRVLMTGTIYIGSGSADDPDSLEDFTVLQNSTDITSTFTKDQLEALQRQFIKTFRP